MRRLTIAERRHFVALDRLIAESEKLTAAVEALADDLARRRRAPLLDHPFRQDRLRAQLCLARPSVRAGGRQRRSTRRRIEG